MTNQERTKILEMGASGKLTIEQADQFLERMGTQSTAFAEKRTDQSVLPAGFPTFTAKQLAALEAYEVDADYIKALHEAGLRDLTAKQLIALKNHEVDADEIVALWEAGFTDLTAEHLIALKTYEVDVDSIRALHEVGFVDLTVERLIALKEQGE